MLWPLFLDVKRSVLDLDFYAGARAATPLRGQFLPSKESASEVCCHSKASGLKWQPTSMKRNLQVLEPKKVHPNKQGKKLRREFNGQRHQSVCSVPQHRLEESIEELTMRRSSFLIPK